MQSFMLYLVGAIMLLLPGLTHAAEYTAKIVQVVPHIQTPFTKNLDSAKELVMTGKIYVKGDKERTEVKIAPNDAKIAQHSRSSITITRPDKKLSWVINPQSKVYMELRNVGPPSSEQIVRFPGVFVEKARMKKIGTETVNGYECDKFEYEMRPIEKANSSKQFWISKKLGVPIKIVQVDHGRTLSIDLKDIKLEKLDDSLFELPPGYRQMKFPGMP